MVGNGQNFTITQAGVPLEQCPKMIQTLSNSGTFSDIKVGATSVSSMPTSISDANTVCGTTGPVTIAFTSVN